MKIHYKFSDYCLLSITFFLLAFLFYQFYLITKHNNKKTINVDNKVEEVIVKESTSEVSLEKKEEIIEKDLEKKWDGVARITAYSEIDSCHYPDGKGGCLNAYNQTIQIGEIACPLQYKKGTKIEIEGLGKFICMDKTANWVQNNLGMTFDIWIGYGEESHKKAIQFGRKKLRFRKVI